MAIIEIHEDKFEHLGEYAEKVVKYGKHLLECLEELGHGERYAERRPYGFRHHEPTREGGRPYEKEYPRYY